MQHQQNTWQLLVSSNILLISGDIATFNRQVDENREAFLLLLKQAKDY